MSKTEKACFVTCVIVAALVVNYLLYLAGEPRTVWFFNLLGVGQ